MSLPKEGSRDVHDGIIISMVPDICLTPAGGGMVPVPYTIWCRQADAANLANSVRQTDDRSHAVASVVLHCYGDEPGTGGGIYSGTTGAQCTPKTWSQTVRAEGRNMVRHTDQWWMNNRNTYGKLLYTKDLEVYTTPTPDTIDPQMRARRAATLANSASATQTSQLIQADAAIPEAGGSGGLGGLDTAIWVYHRLQGVARGAVEGLEHVRTTRNDCPTKSFCFAGPKDPSQLGEYNKQLTMQQETLETLDPCHYLSNRATYKALGSDQMQSLSASARRNARQNFIAGGGNPSGMAALHCLDMVAGGDPGAICGMGDFDVNSKIGNDWKKVVPSLDEHAEQRCAAHCHGMGALLYICSSLSN